MSAPRIAAVLTGALLGLVAIGIALAGGGILTAYTFGRDADGFLTSPTFVLDTHGHALTTTGAEVLLDPAPGGWDGWMEDAVTVRLTATPTEGDVFLGIGPRAEVEAYLAGVEHSRLVRVDGTTAEMAESPGTVVPEPPASRDLWVASAAGSGSQTLEWDVRSGEWSAVLMRPDATAGLAVTATAAVEIGPLVPVGLLLLLGGLALLAVAATVLVLASRSGAPPRPSAGTAGEAPPTGAAAASTGGEVAGPYPLRLHGVLDEPLSRGLWLVKWLLAVPHFLVLAVLWIVYPFTVFAAGVAILFTGRYPASLFRFHVGVLRWTWRVGHYAYATLGTDRYPPFTLADDPGYPAHLDVTPPGRLSRGLVLVKWWLLALPHLLVVGFLTGGWVNWTVPLGDGDARLQLGGGLIGLLVLVAGVVLLFTGRYPRGLFDLLMGLNRWVFRVAAYVSLMTDTYPPFRLDGGDSEPPAVPPTPDHDAPQGQRELTPH